MKWSGLPWTIRLFHLSGGCCSEDELSNKLWNTPHSVTLSKESKTPWEFPLNKGREKLGSHRKYFLLITDRFSVSQGAFFHCNHSSLQQILLQNTEPAFNYTFLDVGQLEMVAFPSLIQRTLATRNYWTPSFSVTQLWWMSKAKFIVPPKLEGGWEISIWIKENDEILHVNRLCPH